MHNVKKALVAQVSLSDFHFKVLNQYRTIIYAVTKKCYE